MPEYWIIAPYHADKPAIWERVWQFDLQAGVISIGWSQLGYISQLSKHDLSKAMY